MGEIRLLAEMIIEPGGDSLSILLLLLYHSRLFSAQESASKDPHRFIGEFRVLALGPLSTAMFTSMSMPKGRTVPFAVLLLRFVRSNVRLGAAL